MKQTPEQKVIHKINKLFHKAIKQYNLIDENDVLLIALSGGKDSLALVELLGEKRRISYPKFEIKAVHVKMSNIPYSANIDYLQSECDKYKIPFEVVETSFDSTTDHRKSPCFLCSWNRRKMLFNHAQSTGCNKIVLGHHQDDIIETLFMNMFFQGAIGTMPPLLKMNKFESSIIRPMCLIPESLVIQLAQIRNYQLTQKNCPFEETSHRTTIKKQLKEMEAINPHYRSSIWKSMTTIQTDYLPK